MLSENLIKGFIIELKVQEEFLRYGFDISIPTNNASRYDIVVDTGEKLLKIQVKKSHGVRPGVFEFACTSQNVRSHSGTKHKYAPSEVDYFATVWKDIVYLVPLSETSDRKKLYEDDDTYKLTNLFAKYKRLTDEELYNMTQHSYGKTYCIDCGNEIAHGSQRCISCHNKQMSTKQRTLKYSSRAGLPIVDWPSKNELKSLLRNTSFVQIGKKYGVTDNAVRKWCKKYGLPFKAKDIKNISDEEWDKF